MSRDCIEGKKTSVLRKKKSTDLQLKLKKKRRSSERVQKALIREKGRR